MSARAARSLSLAVAVVLGALAACGGEPVAVVVRDLDGPIAGAEIVFHDRDGAAIARATTDAGGRASADVDGGGMVTLLFADDGRRLRGTIVGVERGDELSMQVSRTHVTDVGTAHVLVAPFAGASVYVFQTACATVYTRASRSRCRSRSAATASPPTARCRCW